MSQILFVLSALGVLWVIGLFACLLWLAFDTVLIVVFSVGGAAFLTWSIYYFFNVLKDWGWL